MIWKCKGLPCRPEPFWFQLILVVRLKTVCRFVITFVGLLLMLYCVYGVSWFWCWLMMIFHNGSWCFVFVSVCVFLWSVRFVWDFAGVLCMRRFACESLWLCIGFHMIVIVVPLLWLKCFLHCEANFQQSGFEILNVV